MKKILTASMISFFALLAALVSTTSAFAESDLIDDLTITINVGETRMIGNTSVSCQANISDRVCYIEEVSMGSHYKPKTAYELKTSWQAREKFPSGDGIVTRDSTAGTFPTREMAQARMNQLVQKGYCN